MTYNNRKGYGIYPTLPESNPVEDWRLKACFTFENEIKNDVENNLNVLKKLKKKKSKLDNITKGMIAFSSALSIGGIALTSTAFAAVVGAPLIGVSVVVGLLSQIPNKFKNDVENKISNQKNLQVLFSSKLSKTRQNINKYLNNNVISEEEYKTLLDDFEDFSNEKDKNFSPEEKKLTKKEVMTEMTEALKQNTLARKG